MWPFLARDNPQILTSKVMCWCFSFHFQRTEADCIEVSSRKKGRKRKHTTEQGKGIVEAQCKDCISSSIPKPMDMEDFKAGVYEGRLTDAVYDVQGKPLQSFISNPLNIAVVGEPGSGKSSFINAIRDLRADDPGAAETGVQTTTLEIKAYPHPQLPQTIFWDLPGKGASSFREDALARQVDLNRFDFFIIVGAQRFRTVHIDLVHEIQRMNKDFYFVRSNTDLDMEASKRQRPSDYNEELILLKIKDNCIDGLKRAGVSNPKVFLVSNYET
ncbi:interferon-inducible GTPase 5-like, partial [Sceloporus undulatus]|uniref:interferon-inducible GTPase 5-like n=1 Tax=Sceloporus undulatus TaxID=8520 RepID=UPI001C4BFF20